MIGVQPQARFDELKIMGRLIVDAKPLASNWPK